MFVYYRLYTKPVYPMISTPWCCSSVMHALQHFRHGNTQFSVDRAGVVRVRGHGVCRILGGMMKLVAAISSECYSSGTVLFEPPEMGLPAGLLASPALVLIYQ